MIARGYPGAMTPAPTFYIRRCSACISQWAHRMGAALVLPGTVTGNQYANVYRSAIGLGHHYDYNPLPGTSPTYRWMQGLASLGGEFYLAPDEVRPFLANMRAWHQRLPGLRVRAASVCACA